MEADRIFNISPEEFRTLNNFYNGLGKQDFRDNAMLDALVQTIRKHLKKVIDDYQSAVAQDELGGERKASIFDEEDVEQALASLKIFIVHLPILKSKVNEIIKIIQKLF